MPNSTQVKLQETLPVGVIGLAGMIVAGLFLLAVVVLAGERARDWAVDDIESRTQATLALDQALLESELDRHRATPVALATEPAVQQALRSGDPGALSRVSARLDLLASQTGAAAIYLLDARGVAVAASNYRTASSFLGADFGYRPYFGAAMRSGADEYFAVGAVSREPGLYLSRRIASNGRIVGVAVVKVDLRRVEAAWARQTGEAMVADGDGVILLASRPDRRFRTLGSIPAERLRTLRDSRQFGAAGLKALDLPLEAGDEGPVKIQGDTFVQVRRRLPIEGWTLILLTPAGDADRAAVPVRWAAVLGGALLVVVLAWVWRARLQTAERNQAQAQARRDLEVRVAERTAALTTANARLQGEIDDRKRAEARLRTLQADLVQANRLAHLGQIVAGVAHEINQPVAAIRANADNALTHLSRGQPEPVEVKLKRIQGLTERIGAIVQELRGFARKDPRRLSTVAVDEAVEGALLLVGSRLKGDRVAIVRSGDGRLKVRGDRVRLEQVLVNLLQNAFEALDGQVDGRVELDVTGTAETVAIAVVDNGPGLSRSAIARLFTPFATTKPEGLGLGLVICKDIIESFGGSLAAVTEPRPGARFVITLPRVAG